jgi:hypothetical protein
MLHFLTLPDRHKAIARYFKTWGSELRSRVRFHSYDSLAHPSDLADGTYIYADVDRLSSAEQAHAEATWDRLAERGPAVRLLNDPGKCLRRYDLLRRLQAAGRNVFNVYRLDEIGPDLRFPVFLRLAERHTGALTPLLPDMASLQAAIAKQLAKGRRPEALIAIEFVDTSEKGLFRKFAATRIGDAVLAYRVMYERDWQVRGPPLAEPFMIEAERRYQADNPHRAELLDVFRLANIEFGQIDYALLDGRIQVWEINTNPHLIYAHDTDPPEQVAGWRALAAKLNDAFAAIDDRDPPRTIRGRLARLGKRLSWRASPRA